MPRVEINIPNHFAFETELSVRVSDLNYGAHVGNDRILLFMQEARVLFYRSLGFKDEVSFEGSVGQIITDAAVVYKGESFLGDSLLVKLGVHEFSKYGFDMYYVIHNAATNKEIARGKTGIVCFDYAKRKISTIPETLLKILNEKASS